MTIARDNVEIKIGEERFEGTVSIQDNGVLSILTKDQEIITHISKTVITKNI